MTNEEAVQLQATLAERDNEIAVLAQQERECCEQVRLFADGRRQAAAKRVAIELATKPHREALAAYVMEQRRQHAEKAKADAAAQAKAEADAKANEESALAKAEQEIASLRERLAAKG